MPKLPVFSKEQKKIIKDAVRFIRSTDEKTAAVFLEGLIAAQHLPPAVVSGSKKPH